MEYIFESGTNEIKLGGCSFYTHYNLFYIKFKVGSIVYNKSKALNGIIEKIVIKKIRLFQKTNQEQLPNNTVEFITINHKQSTSCQICNYPPLYIDTLNGYHNQENLCGPEEAAMIVDNYLSIKREMLEQFTLNC